MRVFSDKPSVRFVNYIARLVSVAPASVPGNHRSQIPAAAIRNRFLGDLLRLDPDHRTIWEAHARLVGLQRGKSREHVEAVLGALFNAYESAGERFHDWTMGERLYATSILGVSLFLESSSEPRGLLETLLLTISRSILDWMWVSVRVNSTHLSQRKIDLADVEPVELVWATEQGDPDALLRLCESYPETARNLDPQNLLTKEATDPDARRALRVLQENGNKALKNWVPLPARPIGPQDVVHLLGWHLKTVFANDVLCTTPDGRELTVRVGRTVENELSISVTQRLPYVLGNPERLDPRKEVLNPLTERLKADPQWLPRWFDFSFHDENPGATDSFVFKIEPDGDWSARECVVQARATERGLEGILPSLKALGFGPDRYLLRDCDSGWLGFEDVHDRERRFSMTQPERGVFVFELYDYDLPPDVREPIGIFARFREGESIFPDGWDNWTRITVNTGEGQSYTLVKDEAGQPMEEGTGLKVGPQRSPPQSLPAPPSGAHALAGEVGGGVMLPPWIVLVPPPDDIRDVHLQSGASVPADTPEIVLHLLARRLISEGEIESAVHLIRRMEPKMAGICLAAEAALLLIKNEGDRERFLGLLAESPNAKQIHQALRRTLDLPEPEIPTWDQIGEVLHWRRLFAKEHPLGRFLRERGIVVYQDPQGRLFSPGSHEGQIGIIQYVSSAEDERCLTLETALPLARELARRFDWVQDILFIFQKAELDAAGDIITLTGMGGEIRLEMIRRPRVGGLLVATAEGKGVDGSRHRLLDLNTGEVYYDLPLSVWTDPVKVG